MGKFLDTVEQSFKGLDKTKIVEDSDNNGKIFNVLGPDGKPLTVGAALGAMDKSLESIPKVIKDFYIPLKQAGGPLAATFQRLLMVLQEYKRGLRQQIEQETKVLIEHDWQNAANAIANENPVKEMTSYRAFLLGSVGDVHQRVALHQLAKEYVSEKTTDNRKKEIVSEVQSKTWAIMAASSVSVVLESGLGLDLNAQGENQIAAGNGGCRSGAADKAWNDIMNDSSLNGLPLVQQLKRTAALVATAAGVLGIADTMTQFARRAGEASNASPGDGDGECVPEEMFYTQIAVQSKDVGHQCNILEKTNKELYQHEKSWAPLTQKPEAEFVSSVKSTLVKEVEQNMLRNVSSQQNPDRENSNNNNNSNSNSNSNNSSTGSFRNFFGKK